MQIALSFYLAFLLWNIQTLIRRLNLLPLVKIARLKTERNTRQKKNYTTAKFLL